MIPAILESGARVIAPDLLGFGRSDKSVQKVAYTFSFHRDFLLRFVEHLTLRNITLVVQDWGGTPGLTLPVDLSFRSRLDRLFVMNTVLPVGKSLGPHFYEWRSLVRSMHDLPVGQLIREVTPQLSDQEVPAYDAPFPDIRFKAGDRAFAARPDPRLPRTVDSQRRRSLCAGVGRADRAGPPCDTSVISR
jgi:haloalkane dehalogenase